MQSRFGTTLLFAAASVAHTGCTVAVGDITVANQQARCYRQFFDTSASTGGSTNAQWEAGAMRLCDLLTYGDAAEIYLINDTTTDNPPAFRESIVPFPKHGTMREQKSAQEQRLRVRRNMREVVKKVLNERKGGGSKTSDVLGFIERSRPDPSRREVTVLFTDALESADKGLNLERTRLSDINAPQLIQEMATRRRWAPGALRGDIHVVLPDPSKVPNRNSTRDLEAFYRLLIKSLGADLVAFETYLTL